MYELNISNRPSIRFDRLRGFYYDIGVHTIKIENRIRRCLGQKEKAKKITVW